MTSSQLMTEKLFIAQQRFVSELGEVRNLGQLVRGRNIFERLVNQIFYILAPRGVQQLMKLKEECEQVRSAKPISQIRAQFCIDRVNVEPQADLVDALKRGRAE